MYLLTAPNSRILSVLYMELYSTFTYNSTVFWHFCKFYIVELTHLMKLYGKRTNVKRYTFCKTY